MDKDPCKILKIPDFLRRKVSAHLPAIPETETPLVIGPKTMHRQRRRKARGIPRKLAKLGYTAQEIKALSPRAAEELVARNCPAAHNPEKTSCQTKKR